jgi:hypothetical protein
VNLSVVSPTEIAIVIAHSSSITSKKSDDFWWTRGILDISNRNRCTLVNTQEVSAPLFSNCAKWDCEDFHLDVTMTA